MSDVFKVSQSKVKTFRRCHQAYDYRYVQGLRRKRKSRPLQFGTMIHKALERHFNGDDALEYFEDLRKDVAAMKLFAQEREEYGDILVDTKDIITDYLDYWPDGELRPIRKARRGAEHTFEIELMPGVVWTGKMDAIARTPNKLRWLVEHKTYTRKPSEDDRWRNLQSVTYFRANDILGWQPLDGCLWDYIKSKPPAVPGILQDGTLSSKKIDTLPSTVERVIAEHKGDLGKVDALRSMAKKNRGEYFQRIHTPVNRAVADLVFTDFEATVREMVDNHGKCSDMNIDKHCSWCDYESLCRAKLQGLDVDYIKEREYTDGTKPETDSDEKSPVHVATAPESGFLDPENRAAAHKKGK
jgi:CRISPR/Cas system-associated exonuclease Cas4 (RecB family)